MKELKRLFNKDLEEFFAAKTAIMESYEAGEDTVFWNFSHICEDVKIGKNCTIGEGVHIGPNVIIGDNCKIGNGAQIFEGVTIGDNCFIGPCVCFTNDLYPKIGREWKIVKTVIRDNVSIGANSTIVCGALIQEDILIGAGSVVPKKFFFKSYPNKIYAGNPIRFIRGL